MIEHGNVATHPEMDISLDLERRFGGQLDVSLQVLLGDTPLR